MRRSKTCVVQRPPDLLIPLVIALALFCISAAAQSHERVLHVFTYSPSCDSPTAPLIANAAGNLYGSTLVGGGNKMGCIFELSPTAAGWQETTLYSFNGFSKGDGSGPTLHLYLTPKETYTELLSEAGPMMPE